jgi:protein gp37
MRVAARLEAMGQAKYAGLTRNVAGKAVWTGRIAIADARTFEQPLRWKRSRRIFVNSMSDLFHEAVSDAVIDRVFAIMAACPQHTFQILTKRADRMRDYMQRARISRAIEHAVPLPNVWLGVSVEDQATADERIPLLLGTPAAVRWISAEPLLGHIDLTDLNPGGAQSLDALRGVSTDPDYAFWRTLDWVVAGGESGPQARPVVPNWIRSLRDQCNRNGVPFLFKQWGEYRPTGEIRGGSQVLQRVGKRAAGRELDGRTHQEFPTAG